MNILYLLIPLGLLLLGLAIAAFFWAVGSGQFDDLESPAMSVVMDDDTKPAAENRRQADPQKDKKDE
ncbi:MAG: cbb3-type cytochrome oxidase assembly protein CcoS [Gammaproteobacteria bacterium]|jgi:cbb3-type cytochrome oxidase maturation protein|nr:cbb3-type cytochrome oxidase assembly protein CcoS [Gammaproteobacteria bacterium]